MDALKQKISVVIPVLNGGKTLPVCLESVINQRHLAYEIVVVDNGSVDDTEEIINKFREKDSRIVYVSEPRRGRGAARNAGVAVAQGEIIAMTDVDCVVPPDWLGKLTSPIREGRAVAAIGFEKDAVDNYWSRARQAEDWRFLQTKIDGDYVNHIDTKNFAIDARIIKKLGFDSRLAAYEDWDLFIRLKEKGMKVMFLPDVHVFHRHDASARELASTQFSRAKGVAAIINKYRRDGKFRESFKNDESARSVKNLNFLLFFPWAAWQFVYRPAMAPYLVISDFFWKLGLVAAAFDFWRRRFGRRF